MQISRHIKFVLQQVQRFDTLKRFAIRHSSTISDETTGRGRQKWPSNYKLTSNTHRPFRHRVTKTKIIRVACL